MLQSDKRSGNKKQKKKKKGVPPKVTAGDTQSDGDLPRSTGLKRSGQPQSQRRSEQSRDPKQPQEHSLEPKNWTKRGDVVERSCRSKNRKNLDAVDRRTQSRRSIQALIP